MCFLPDLPVTCRLRELAHVLTNQVPLLTDSDCWNFGPNIQKGRASPFRANLAASHCITWWEYSAGLEFPPRLCWVWILLYLTAILPEVVCLSPSEASQAIMICPEELNRGETTCIVSWWWIRLPSKTVYSRHLLVGWVHLPDLWFQVWPLLLFSGSVRSYSFDPMDCSTPGFPVLHSLPEFAQIHVHWVGDAIQPSHPLSSPSPALNLSQHQGLCQWVSSSHHVAKVLELQLQHQSFQWMFRVDFL